MKILCDEAVATRYQHAIESRSWCAVVDAVNSILGEGASDLRVSQYAADHSYVLLTHDTDFFAMDTRHGVVYYDSGLEASDLADRLEAIESAYPVSEYDGIRESLSEWG